MRTLTERIAKRIRRGQPWQRSSVPDSVIVQWAENYAKARRAEPRSVDNGANMHTQANKRLILNGFA